MKTIMATDASILICNEEYYYASQVAPIVKRYYEKFGKLAVCGRVIHAKEIPSTHENVTSMIDSVTEIPSLEKALLGLYDNRIQKLVSKGDFLICRCPGVVAHRVADIARKCGKHYLAEAMGCAWDAYWNHGLVGKMAAPYVFAKMKQTVYHADYALYVTNEFLQKRYPCKKPSVAASNVQFMEVADDVLNKRIERIKACDTKSLRLMTTAAVDVRYKGQEFVIKAIPLLNKAGIRVQYLLVGGGEQTYLKEIARTCGVEDQVVFIGRLPLAEVFDLLDTVDIYIQPSLQEGLPRAVIEAMSRGCPAIGAKTAGIPELLSPECVVKRKSAKDIAETIIRIANREKMKELAKGNFDEAKNYQNSVLDAKREAYFSYIKAECDRKNSD